MSTESDIPSSLSSSLLTVVVSIGDNWSGDDGGAVDSFADAASTMTVVRLIRIVRSRRERDRVDMSERDESNVEDVGDRFDNVTERAADSVAYVCIFSIECMLG